MTEIFKSHQARVLVCFGSSPASMATLKIAVSLARAFESEMEGVFIENRQLVALAALPFAREISSLGRRSRRLTSEQLAREMQLAARAMRQHLEALARQAGIPFRYGGIQARLDQVFQFAAKRETMSFLALAEPLEHARIAELRQLLATHPNVAGIIVTGPRARYTQGPIVAVLEDGAASERLLHTATRLAETSGAPLVLARLPRPTLAADLIENVFAELGFSSAIAPRFEFENAIVENAERAIELLRRLGGSVLVAELGGQIVPDDEALHRLVLAAETPIILLPPGAAAEVESL